jgi:hypothetical protein
MLSKQWEIKTKTVIPPHDYIPSELGREYLDLLGSQVDWIEQNPAKAPTTSKKAMCEMILTQHKKNMSHLRLIFARFGDKTY